MTNASSLHLRKIGDATKQTGVPIIVHNKHQAVRTRYQQPQHCAMRWGHMGAIIGKPTPPTNKHVTNTQQLLPALLVHALLRQRRLCTGVVLHLYRRVSLTLCMGKLGCPPPSCRSTCKCAAPVLSDVRLNLPSKLESSNNMYPWPAGMWPLLFWAGMPCLKKQATPPACACRAS